MKRICTLLVFITITMFSFAQKGLEIDSVSFNDITFRSVGPAFMTGRISDVVIDPEDENHWYVGVASGGVWETKNSGVTFQPLFDKQKVYSIGCITLDPNTRNLWVGSGENVGGRHISFGDGIYLSKDGGKSWENKGLKESNHISKIIVHPTNPNTIWVASQGPLWSKGGDRGVFITIDGGKTWQQTLGDKEWTGATDLLIDPKNPDVLYAATWQRHRTVAAYLGGGPKSGIHKSVDGGLTWEKLKTGLPAGNMGKIGLAMSPQNSDVIYAAVELDLKKGGFFRSDDRGRSWIKKSDIISGGTGPHYYQEIWASPHQFDRVYFANNYFKVSNDGGANFKAVGKKYKHVDNHAMAFKMSDSDYLLVGTDGGLYESFDLAKTWRHMGNMPITQFYKLAVDDAKPFYNIYGGTQDNSTQGGKSRTLNKAGITNADWKVILGGDGHQPATEPGNPNIVYGQSQQGWYSRVDMATGERVGIRPQPAADEDYERYNWDAPILVSSHNPERIFVASQRLWRSDNRGDKWTAISPDLTRDEERLELPIMGRKQSYKNPWDVYAMSTYNTITSISESPVNEKVLYIGTDDGYIQCSKDGGKTWAKTAVQSLSGVPARAYVNDIKADLFDENKVYVALDAHKQGNYKPYLFMSADGGKSWNNIGSKLPEKDYVWRIVQDHEKPDLFFVGTEFGIYFTPNSGKNWVKLKGGLPTISFRDLAIQKRENDLVAASFGRSFYILDDYSFLRSVNEQSLAEEAALFQARDAYLFRLRKDGRQKGGSLGAQHFYGKNPEHGATFSYYIKEGKKTNKEERQEKEKALNKEGQDIPFPGWETLTEENYEEPTQYWLSISDMNGNTLRKLVLKNSKGMHRVTWDMKVMSQFPVNAKTKNENDKTGMWYVAPGTYQAQMYMMKEGQISAIGSVQQVNLKPINKSTLQSKPLAERNLYSKDYLTAQLRKSEMNLSLKKLETNCKAVHRSVERIQLANADEYKQLKDLSKSMDELKRDLKGIEAKNAIGEKNSPTLEERLDAAGATLWGSNYGPTETAKSGLQIANNLMDGYEAEIKAMYSKLETLYVSFKKQGAPVVLEMEVK